MNINRIVAAGRLAGVRLAALPLLLAAPTFAADETDAAAPAKAATPAIPGETPKPTVEADAEANREPAAPTHRFPASPASVRPTGPAPKFRGPDVTIIAAERRTVYEYRQHGQLRMVKIVPKRGKPYYLVPSDPTRNHHDLEQADTLVPQWVLWEF